MRKPTRRNGASSRPDAMNRQSVFARGESRFFPLPQSTLLHPWDLSQSRGASPYANLDTSRLAAELDPFLDFPDSLSTSPRPREAPPTIGGAFAFLERRRGR